MSITVTEKDHWKTRLELRINRKIDALVAATNPGFLTQVDVESKKKAKDALGISGIVAEAKELETQSKKLREQSEQLIEKALRIAKRLPEDTSILVYGREIELNSAIAAQAKLLRDSIMEESDLGRQILRLEAEKEELLDTIWLATSPKQIKALWESLGTLLESTPTELQEQALKCEPEQ